MSSMDDLTDREALEALLRRFGLAPYTGQPLDGAANSDARPGVDLPDADEVLLVADVGKVGGYSNFHARFTFDDDGKFQELGIWE